MWCISTFRNLSPPTVNWSVDHTHCFTSFGHFRNWSSNPRQQSRCLWFISKHTCLVSKQQVQQVWIDTSCLRCWYLIRNRQECGGLWTWKQIFLQVFKGLHSTFCSINRSRALSNKLCELFFVISVSNGGTKCCICSIQNMLSCTQTSSGAAPTSPRGSLWKHWRMSWEGRIKEDQM